MKTTGAYPRLHADTADVAAIGHAGGVVLTETIRATGLDRVLSEALSPWRKPLAVHDPGKIILDLAITLALGGDALSDVATVRAEPGLYGQVASDPTVSRLITALAGDADQALAAIGEARQHARERAWSMAGEHAPDAAASPDVPLVIDLDATLITAHSEKEDAKPTFKRGFGFHPLCAFADHGPAGTGEMLAVQLRAGNAGSNTAADHITVTKAALAQLSSSYATGAGHVARTASATRKTQGCATCHCTGSIKTKSGARSSPWPVRSPPGRACSLIPSMRPDAGNRNGSGTASSRSPQPSPATGDA